MGLFTKFFSTDIEVVEPISRFLLPESGETENNVTDIEIFRDEEVGVVLRNSIGATISSGDLGDINPHDQETVIEQAVRKARLSGWEIVGSWSESDDYKWARVSPLNLKVAFVGDVSVSDAFDLVKNAGYEAIELVTLDFWESDGQTHAEFVLKNPRGWHWGFNEPV